jgi:hypothetical protein
MANIESRTAPSSMSLPIRQNLQADARLSLP